MELQLVHIAQEEQREEDGGNIEMLAGSLEMLAGILAGSLEMLAGNVVAVVHRYKVVEQ